MFLALLPAAAFGDAAETVRVGYVLDGDSLVLDDGREVRLIGINAPEFGKDGAPNQPLAVEARAELARLAHGVRVTLELDRELRDRYGRLLAHVRLADGTSIQETMLRRGLAWAIVIPPNLARLKERLAAENEARARQRGVWGRPDYAPAAAEKLTRADTGFHLVRGEIARVGRGKKMIFLDLAPRMALKVPRADWEKYFPGRPEDMVGRRVAARGWVTAHRDRLYLRVQHPSVLTLIE